MYCPKCTQPIAANLKYCSKCGFYIENVKKLLSSNGELKLVNGENQIPVLSGRQKGIRQGVKLVILSVVLLPLYFIIETLLPSVENTNLDELPQLIFQALLSIILLSGIARIIYAFSFEQTLVKKIDKVQQSQLKTEANAYTLPPHQSIPITDFNFSPVNTAEMVARPSVTEGTTSLFNKS
jgi:hypothetical protein